MDLPTLPLALIAASWLKLSKSMYLVQGFLWWPRSCQSSNTRSSMLSYNHISAESNMSPRQVCSCISEGDGSISEWVVYPSLRTNLLCTQLLKFSGEHLASILSRYSLYFIFCLLQLYTLFYLIIIIIKLPEFKSFLLHMRRWASPRRDIFTT